jgi:hypothetical protein
MQYNHGLLRIPQLFFREEVYIELLLKNGLLSKSKIERRYMKDDFYYKSKVVLYAMRNLLNEFLNIFCIVELVGIYRNFQMIFPFFLVFSQCRLKLCPQSQSSWTHKPYFLIVEGRKRNFVYTYIFILFTIQFRLCVHNKFIYLFSMKSL